MRSLTSALALQFLALLTSAGWAAMPMEVWSTELPSAQKTVPIQKRLEALDAAASGLPQELEPAVRFQKVFLKILATPDIATWRAEITSFASQPDGTPLSNGLREVSRVWLARAEMADIDGLLRGFYNRNIRFPGSLAELNPALPQSLAKDPWGGAWSYAPQTPHGFARLVAQRYHLDPARFPNLVPLAEAVRNRPSQTHAWSVTPRDVAGHKALEFRTGQSVAIIQPGGKIGDCTLLYIGDKWALMAGLDQLFATAF